MHAELTTISLYFLPAMARRSGRKTKAPEHFDPVVRIRDNSTKMSKKNKRQKRNLLTSANALQTNSPILKEDIQSLFASTILRWSSMTEEKKRNLIDAFPPAYRIHNTDETGKLRCPLSEKFVANDSIIKRDVARFKRDVEAGYYLKKWQDEGERAMKERAEGLFNDYIKQHAEDSFGETQDSHKDHKMMNGMGEKKMESDNESKGD